MYTQEEYNAKRAARLERLRAAAARAEAQSNQATTEASTMARAIPFGQPILVGHHSEKRDRNYRARIENKFRRGYELHKKAAHYNSKAEAAESNNAIYSDDPTAADQIREKLSALESEQAEMKRINAALRKGTDFDSLEMSEEHRARLLSVAKHQAYYNPLTRGFPPYALQNNNANINRLKKRLSQVEKRQAQPDQEATAGDIKIQSSPSENRIRIFYPGKPDAATRTELKRHGYRWTPSLQCWQAYYNSNAMTYAKQIIKDSTTEATPPEEPRVIATITHEDGTIEEMSRAKDDPTPATFKAVESQPAAEQPRLF